MQVLVTGANGFIGGAVAAALIAAGHKVRGLLVSKNAKAGAVAAPRCPSGRRVALTSAAVLRLMTYLVGACVRRTDFVFSE
jgi:nucleoside-diphosphate-sugar epimerase